MYSFVVPISLTPTLIWCHDCELVYYKVYHISALGHQGTHPTPLEAMQRLRVLLLGKGDLIEVQNPSVQLEPENSDISTGEAAELLERQRSIEEEIIVSKDITSDIDTVDEAKTAHLESLQELDVIYMTQKEIDEKMNSNSFQVRIDSFDTFEFLNEE